MRILFHIPLYIILSIVYVYNIILSIISNSYFTVMLVYHCIHTYCSELLRIIHGHSTFHPGLNPRQHLSVVYYTIILIAPKSIHNIHQYGSARTIIIYRLSQQKSSVSPYASSPLKIITV